MSELKPCPFCGGEAEISLFLGNYHVACTECLGAIFPCRGMLEEEAIEAWNTRADVPETHVGKIRAKAIKDFLDKLQEHETENWVDHQEYGITWADLELVAEQMKGGVSDDIH